MAPKQSPWQQDMALIRREKRIEDAIAQVRESRKACDCPKCKELVKSSERQQGR